MSSHHATDALQQTHASIFALQAEMKSDSQFEALCRRNGLPWDFPAGYEPRWYNGPAPGQTKVLFLMAEPGAVTETEKDNLLPVISHDDWIGTHNLRLQEHYWRENLRELCRHIWPTDTERNMYEHLGGSCAFWMSLPPDAQTKAIPAAPLSYFLEKYLSRFLALFPKAVILAVGGKATERLTKVGRTFERCSAFTKPESNKPKARESWRAAGLAVARRLAEGNGSKLIALRLGNFKAFAETQTIPLRPLTLIFGANSSGKSSIIHGLLFGHEANRTGKWNVRRTQLGGDSVDLGGYEQFRHQRVVPRGVESGETFGMEFQPAKPVPADYVEFDLDVYVDPSSGPEMQRPLGSARRLRFRRRCGETGSCEITLDGARVLASGDWVAGARGPVLNHHHPLLGSALNELMAQYLNSEDRGLCSANRLEEIIVDESQKLCSRVRFDGFFPRLVSVEEADSSNAESRAQVLCQGAGSLEFRIASLWRRVVGALIEGAGAVLTKELNRLAYLGPFRSCPPRGPALDQSPDPNWVAGGGYAYEVLRRNSSIRAEVNRWLRDPQRLSTAYEVQVEYLWPIRELLQRQVPDLTDAKHGVAALVAELIDGNPKGKTVEKVLQEVREEIKYGLGFAERREDDKYSEDEAEWCDSEGILPTARVQSMSLVDQRTGALVSYRDVGIGVSQVVPVLVHALGSDRRIIAIEQPEIHLHPKLQAELADVFIESALGERKNMFLLETHSEHLILRVLRRIRETTDGELGEGLTPIRPEDVAVLYVLPTAEGSKVIEIPIRPDGEFAEPWPEGFFPDRAKELF